MLNPRFTTLMTLAATAFVFVSAAGHAADIAVGGTDTYSAAATETTLQFDGRVGMRSSGTPGQSEALAQVRKQVQYIQSNLRRNKMAAVRSDWSAQITNIEQAQPGLYRIYYHFSATAVITNAMVNTVEILLPVNPDSIETAERTAACMDEHKGAFWYYWDPMLPGCGMVLNSDYLSFVGTFVRKANTVQTYPEYNRLFNGGQMNVVIMMGKVYPTDSNDPHISNPWSYPVIRNSLVQLGFSDRVLGVDEVRGRLPTTVGQEPFLEEFLLATRKGTIHVTLFYGETGMEHEGYSPRAFHTMYKWAVENANLIIYAGHAGTGKNLDLSLIRKSSGLTINARKDLYQILLISACYPYAYYVHDYFAFKASPSDPYGTKNLDIMAEGIEGGFDHPGPQVSTLMRAVVGYANGTKLTSYQEIVNSDPAFSSSLFSVLGDEDNPQTPAQVN